MPDDEPTPYPKAYTHYAHGGWEQPNRKLLPTLCGRFINAYEHTIRPTCPRCKAELKAVEDREL